MKEKLEKIFTKGNIIGTLAGVLVFFASVKISAAIDVMNTFGQLGVNRSLGFFALCGKMAKEHTLSFVFVLVISIIIGVLVSKLIGNTRKEFDRNGNLIAPESIARPMTEKEMKEILEECPADNPDGIILGLNEKNGKLLSIPTIPQLVDKYITSELLIAFGPSGTRKTSGHIIANLYQYMEMGRSILVSDPKGEIYKETIAVAKYYHYNVHILNTIVGRADCSDGCDLLKPIRESVIGGNLDNAIAMVDLLVDVIMQNTRDESKTELFWEQATGNLLKLILLAVTRATGIEDLPKIFVANSRGEKRTMMSVYNFITCSDTDFKDSIAKLLKEKSNEEMLGAEYNVWKENAQASQIRASLATRLKIFDTPSVCRTLSENDIDLAALAKEEKTLIYLEVPDGPNPYACVLSMFISMVFYNIEKYVDFERNGKRLDPPFSFVFEEAANIGRIPNLQNYMSTVRSRGIAISLYFQDLAQLTKMYGEEDAKTMLANAGIKLLVGTGNYETARYFSDTCGTMTVYDTSTRRERHALTNLPLSFTAMKTTEKKEVPIYTPTELLGANFPMTKMLVLLSGHNPLMIKKYYYKDHPLYKVRLINANKGIVELTPAMHSPEWRRIQINKENIQSGGKTIDYKDKEYEAKYIENFYEPDSFNVDEESNNEEKGLKAIKKKIANELFEEVETEESFQRIESKNSFNDLRPALSFEEMRQANEAPDNFDEKEIDIEDAETQTVFGNDYFW